MLCNADFTDFSAQTCHAESVSFNLFKHEFLAFFAKNFASLRLNNKISIEVFETNPKSQSQH